MESSLDIKSQNFSAFPDPWYIKQRLYITQGCDRTRTMLGKVCVCVCVCVKERDENIASRVDKPTKRSIACAAVR